MLQRLLLKEVNENEVSRIGNGNIVNTVASVDFQKLFK